jgi:hypothetical protein
MMNNDTGDKLDFIANYLCCFLIETVLMFKISCTISHFDVWTSKVAIFGRHFSVFPVLWLPLIYENLFLLLQLIAFTTMLIFSGKSLAVGLMHDTYR